MLPILQRRFRALENSKAAMLEQVRSLPADRLNERPAPDKWSAAELLSHITKVEAGILQSVKQKLGSEARERVKMGDRVASLIVRNVMRSPLRVKIPKELASIQPEEQVSASQAIAEWDRVRHDWQDFLEHVRGPEMKGGVFAHPKSGWFTLPETVLFLRLHHDHHRAQLTRIAKAVTSSPEAVAA